jgi:hypothetical protein
MSRQFRNAQDAPYLHQVPSQATQPGARVLLAAGPHVDVIYESETERDDLLRSLRRAGLGEFPLVLVQVESEPRLGSTFSVGSSVRDGEQR